MERPPFLDSFPAPLGELAIGLPPLASAAHPLPAAPAGAGVRALTEQAALLSRLV
jgi:hypothetical protein